MVDIASIIGLAGALGSGAMGLMASGKQAGASGDALQAALMNQAAQRRQADQQYELATASRTDANGNKIIYIPGEGWKTLLGPEGATQQSANNELTRAELIRQMVQGEPQRNREGRVRTEASAAAEPLLRDFSAGYGAPTKAGVRGKRIVSNVTGASENADRLRNAATSTALRQGGNSTPLGGNLSSLDRNATAGIRTALARGEEEGDQMYDAMYKAWAGNKLDPYAALSAKASGTPQFRATDVGGDAATSMNQAAAVGAMRGSGSEALARGFAGVPGTIMAGGQSPSYDLFTAGVTNAISEYLKSRKGSSGSPASGLGAYDTGATSRYVDF
jgi:hypothetical protein